MSTDHDIPKLIINKLTKAQYDQAVKNADELYLTPDDGGIPDQTGQSGKFLTTNGTSTSWATVSIPTVNNSTITIQKNSTTVNSFTLNQASGATINISVPTKVSDLTNDSGFITGITASNVTTALGYTPYNSSNPSGYISGITANNVTTALGYTPYNSTNPNGYISGITANNVTTALGYTPYNSTNPNGYITSADIPTIKNLNTNNTTGQTVSASESLTGTGTVNLHKVSKTGSYNDLLNKPTIPTVNDATLTIQKNGSTVSSFTANASSNVTCNITVPTKTSDITNDSGYITSHQDIKVLKTDNTAAQSTSAGEAIAGNGTISLHKIAKTGTFSDLLSKPSSISGYGITDAYTKTEIDGMISSVYKPAGSVAFASLPTLAAGVLGNVYNVTDAFTTTSDFVEGSGKNYPAGTNVVVVNTGTSSSPIYKFDVLSGFVDLSGYVPTSRKINNKALSADITLSASDVGALPDNTTIPVVNNATLTIQKNSATISTFSANASSNVTCNISVPTKVSDLTNDSGYTTNTGTVTSVRVQAGTGLSSSTSTAQNTTLNTTISIASGYKLPTTTEWNSKQDALPAQSGNTGKFLTTNGSTMSWATVDALPSQSGQSGKYLTTNGTSASWGTISIPTVNNGVLTILQNGTTVTTFSANASSASNADIATTVVKFRDWSD